MSSPCDGQTFLTNARPSPSGQRPVLAPAPIAGLEPLTPRTFRRLAWLSLRNAPATRPSWPRSEPPREGWRLAQPSSPARAAPRIRSPSRQWPHRSAWLRSSSSSGSSWPLNSEAGRETAAGWSATSPPNSSQLVHPVGREWVLTDHYTAHRGRGEAGAFRRHVFAHLAREADLHGVGIRLDTRVPKLADLYVRDMPGLELTATRRGTLTTVYSFARSPRSLDGS